MERTDCTSFSFYSGRVKELFVPRLLSLKLRALGWTDGLWYLSLQSPPPSLFNISWDVCAYFFLLTERERSGRFGLNPSRVRFGRLIFIRFCSLSPSEVTGFYSSRTYRRSHSPFLFH